MRNVLPPRFDFEYNQVRGALRWIVEIAVVLLISALVFGWKRLRIQRRQILW